MSQHITEKMECSKEDRQVRISKFIRFNRDKAEIGTDPTHERKIENIENFVGKWAGKDGSVRWTVFGFASPDGEQQKNKNLSKERANAVKDQMCLHSAIDCERPGATKLECGGENHPINGVANSRSAVIAVCVQ